jgi:hypothetical protein
MNSDGSPAKAFPIFSRGEQPRERLFGYSDLNKGGLLLGTAGFFSQPLSR